MALETPAPPSTPRPTDDLYGDLLVRWCDGLLAHQLTAPHAGVHAGGFLCPGCGLIHGRSADAVYPLLRAARQTGNDRYVAAVEAVHDWGERHVSRPDGSWTNEVVLSDWRGTTVFRLIAMAEAIRFHGELLSPDTRDRWLQRAEKGFAFIDRFITFDTGNINYPITAAYAFTLGADLFGRSDYARRGHDLARSALDYFTPGGMIFGEGHPQRERTAKGHYPVDLAYNVEESLPALTLYGLHVGDTTVLDAVVASLRTHMEFMLPDGGWDDSWGSRNYKWSWWGSRTSDGCQPGYALMSDHDPRFHRVADRNLALLDRSTRDGLLQGGPHYAAQGYNPCVHHTFAHAKAIATVLDMRPAGQATEQPGSELPRDRPYGVRSFPDIGAHLVSVGPWRATLTDYDFDYLAPKGGGHPSGGALSLLYHERLGPIFAASMTRYALVEPANQQLPVDDRHPVATPRIELTSRQEVTSLNDLAASLTATGTPGAVTAEARGVLRAPGHQADGDGPVLYRLSYVFKGDRLSISARVDGLRKGQTARLVLPVIMDPDQATVRTDRHTVVVPATTGALTARVVNAEFDSLQPPAFNLIPGFVFQDLSVALCDGQAVIVSVQG